MRLSFITQVFTAVYRLQKSAWKNDKKLKVEFKIYDVTDWTAQRCRFSANPSISVDCMGLILQKDSKMFHRFYKLDHLVTTNGTLNDIVSYIFDLIFPVVSYSNCFNCFILVL